jgi:hypothetical protein
MGEVSLLNRPGDSKEGVLRSVNDVDGGAEASIMRSVGETVPVGRPAGESVVVKPGGS